MNDRLRSAANGYDVAVIGAGSAGFSAAITAADLGANVALIGHGTIGGTCVNVGCVPSKTMIRAAETIHQASSAARFSGVQGNVGIKNWQALIAQKDELVAELRAAKYADVLPAYEHIAYIEGKARVHSDGAGITVGDTRIPARRIVIATGSDIVAPDIPGISEVPYLTSTTALELPEQPESLIVLGGGYIGCELAQMFSRTGTKVTIVCRTRLLPDAEPEVSDALTQYLTDEGLQVVAGISYAGIVASDAGVSLTVESGGTRQTLEAQHVMLATGRLPNTHELGLSEAGVTLTGNGGIEVDDRLRTSHPNIYAAGDVTGRDMFVYMAAYGAKIAAENALNGNSRVYDATAMPAVVFTDPQVASVGLTEAAAIAAGLKVRTSVVPLSQVPRALAARDTRGLIKLVAAEDDGRLVGAHIIAPEGADSIQTAALAIKQGLTYTELGDTIFPYLTTVEGLKLAAQTFDKNVEQLSCCAG